MREALLKVIQLNVESVNDSATDGDLLHEVAKNILEEKVNNIEVLISEEESTKVIDCNKTLEGIWVLREDHNKWILNKCHSIKDAIIRACNHIEETAILANQQILRWDILDNMHAFYLDNEIIRLVELTEVTYD